MTGCRLYAFGRFSGGDGDRSFVAAAVICQFALGRDPKSGCANRSAKPLFERLTASSILRKALAYHHTIADGSADATATRKLTTARPTSALPSIGDDLPPRLMPRLPPSRPPVAGRPRRRGSAPVSHGPRMDSCRIQPIIPVPYACEAHLAEELTCLWPPAFIPAFIARRPIDRWCADPFAACPGDGSM